MDSKTVRTLMAPDDRNRVCGGFSWSDSRNTRIVWTQIADRPTVAAVALSFDRLYCAGDLLNIDGSIVNEPQRPARACESASQKTGTALADAPSAYDFAAYLPRLAAPVRIDTYMDAQVFARRWAIRDKDPTVRQLVRRMERANSSEDMARAMKEFRRELAARGLLSGTQ